MPRKLEHVSMMCFMSIRRRFLEMIRGWYNLTHVLLNYCTENKMGVQNHMRTRMYARLTYYQKEKSADKSLHWDHPENAL
jgi:hypothetical protein